MKSQDLITDSLPTERSPTERIKEIQNLCGKHNPGHQGELLEKRDIKLINGLMAQVFFGKTQMNGVLQKMFHRLTAIMILKSKKVAVVNMVGQKQDILSILESRISCISDVV